MTFTQYIATMAGILGLGALASITGYSLISAWFSRREHKLDGEQG